MTLQEIQAALAKVAASKERAKKHRKPRSHANIPIADLTPEQQEERRAYFRAYARKWRAENPEKDKVYKERWYAERSEEIKAKRRAYRLAHKDEINAYRRAKRAERKSKQQ